MPFAVPRVGTYAPRNTRVHPLRAHATRARAPARASVTDARRRKMYSLVSAIDWVSLKTPSTRTTMLSSAAFPRARARALIHHHAQSFNGKFPRSPKSSIADDGDSAVRGSSFIHSFISMRRFTGKIATLLVAFNGAERDRCIAITASNQFRLIIR